MSRARSAKMAKTVLVHDGREHQGEDEAHMPGLKACEGVFLCVIFSFGPVQRGGRRGLGEQQPPGSPGNLYYCIFSSAALAGPLPARPGFADAEEIGGKGSLARLGCRNC